MSESREKLLKALSALTEQDFKFSVQAWGTFWDVYRVPMLGNRPALVAFRILNNQVEIGAIGEAYWDESKMTEALEAAKPN